MASKLLHQHIVEQLQGVLEVLSNLASLPPTVLGDEPNHQPSPCTHRALNRAASLHGATGAPGSPCTPPTRFFVEKKIHHESLVIGALENAFKIMVRSNSVQFPQNYLMWFELHELDRTEFSSSNGIRQERMKQLYKINLNVFIYTRCKQPLCWQRHHCMTKPDKITKETHQITGAVAWWCLFPNLLFNKYLGL